MSVTHTQAKEFYDTVETIKDRYVPQLKII